MGKVDLVIEGGVVRLPSIDLSLVTEKLERMSPDVRMLALKSILELRRRMLAIQFFDRTISWTQIEAVGRFSLSFWAAHDVLMILDIEIDTRRTSEGAYVILRGETSAPPPIPSRAQRDGPVCRFDSYALAERRYVPRPSLMETTHESLRVYDDWSDGDVLDDDCSVVLDHLCGNGLGLGGDPIRTSAQADFRPDTLRGLVVPRAGRGLHHGGGAMA